MLINTEMVFIKENIKEMKTKRKKNGLNITHKEQDK